MRDLIRNTLAVVLTVALSTSVAHAVPIDRFEGPLHQARATGTNRADRATAGVAGALGGYRTIEAEVVGEGIEISGTIIASLYGHATYFLTAGRSMLVWDGDNVEEGITFDGLGGVDLTSDGGTGFRFTRLNYDYAHEAPVVLFITVYSGSSGTRYSQGSLVLRKVYTEETIEVAFTDLSEEGPGGAADFSNVGAITLEVDGGPHFAVDLTLDIFGTNGSCDLLSPEGYPACATPTPTATATASPSPTASATATRTATPTATRTATATRTPTRTPTRTATATRTPTRTATPTWTATSTATQTATPTYTPTHTATHTATVAPTATFTRTPTSTPTMTVTRTPTATATPYTTVIVREVCALSASELVFEIQNSNGYPVPFAWSYAGKGGNSIAPPGGTGLVSVSRVGLSQPLSAPFVVLVAGQAPIAVVPTFLRCTPTPTASPTVTATFTATHTATSTPAATVTPTRTATPTQTHTPSATSTPIATSTPPPTVTNTPSPSATSTSTATPTASATFTPTSTATFTAIPSSTPTEPPPPTLTHTPTSTVTPEATSSIPPTVTATETPNPPSTPTVTPEPEVTPPGFEVTPTPGLPDDVCTSEIDVCGVCGGSETDMRKCSEVPPNCVLVRPTKEMRQIAARVRRAANGIRGRLQADIARASIIPSCAELKSTRRYAPVLQQLSKANARVKRDILKAVLVCDGSCLTVSFATQVSGIRKTLARAASRAQDYARAVVGCGSGSSAPQSGSSGPRTEDALNKIVKDTNKIVSHCKVCG